MDMREWALMEETKAFIEGLEEQFGHMNRFRMASGWDDINKIKGQLSIIDHIRSRVELWKEFDSESET